MNLGLLLLAYWHPEAVLLAAAVVLSVAGPVRRAPRYRRLLDQLSLPESVAPFAGAGRPGRMSATDRGILLLAAVVIGLMVFSTIHTYFGLIESRLP
jgi:hypothetical protein